METVTLADMEAERDELEQAIAGIKAQLDHAHARVHEDGEYSDSNWYANAKAALRHKGIRYNRVLREIKRLRKAEGEQKDREWERAFVRMAKQTLTEETYDRLVALAWEETGGRP